MVPSCINNTASESFSCSKETTPYSYTQLPLKIMFIEVEEHF